MPTDFETFRVKKKFSVLFSMERFYLNNSKILYHKKLYYKRHLFQFLCCQ